MSGAARRRKQFNRQARAMHKHIDDAVAKGKLTYPKGGASEPYW